MRGIDLWAKSAAAYREKEKFCAACLFLQIANFGSDILFLQTHSFSTQRQAIFFFGTDGERGSWTFSPDLNLPPKKELEFRFFDRVSDFPPPS